MVRRRTAEIGRKLRVALLVAAPTRCPSPWAWRLTVMYTYLHVYFDGELPAIPCTACCLWRPVATLLTISLGLALSYTVFYERSALHSRLFVHRVSTRGPASAGSTDETITGFD